MPWLILFGALIILAVLGFFYLVTRFHKFSFMQRLGEKHKVLSWALSLLPVGALFLFNIINMWATIIVMLHLMLIWALCDLGAFIFKKVKKKTYVKYYTGAIAIGLTTVYMCYGWFCAHHVFQKDYTIYTDKDIGTPSIRVAAFADVHLGITLDGDSMLEQVQRINAQNPDIVLIVGDYVDDDSNKADMEKACAALGRLKSTYGTYFVFGNHDKGYYGYRDFNTKALRSELKANGITILEDKNLLINDSFYLVGRQDRSVVMRKDIDTLISDIDQSKYMLCMDHQPNDYANEAAAGLDLVLSGHTHGGHIFPAGYIGVAMGSNDRFYGSEVRDNTTFIVTSGISGWAIPFKTGAISEYLIIDIKQK